MRFALRFVVFGLLGLQFVACQSTQESSVTETRYLPKSVGDVDLKHFRVADQNRLFVELNGLMERWERASLQSDDVVQAGVQDVIRRYVIANYPTVRDSLESDDPRFRIVSAATLGFSGRPDAVPPLLELMEDPDELVVSNALLSLIELSPVRQDLTPMIPLLEHPDAGVRSNALLLVGRNLDEQNRDDFAAAILRCLEDSDGVVRLQAVAAAGKLKPEQAVPAVMPLTDDEFPKIRIRAALALAELGDRSAVPTLIRLLDGERADVRDAALASLERLTGELHGHDIDAWNRYWKKSGDESGAVPN